MTAWLSDVFLIVSIVTTLELCGTEEVEAHTILDSRYIDCWFDSAHELCGHLLKLPSVL